MKQLIFSLVLGPMSATYMCSYYLLRSDLCNNKDVMLILGYNYMA